MNSVSLIGRLTRDPESHQTKTGKTVVNVGLAVDGYGKDDVTFIDLTIWGPRGEAFVKYHKKGQLVGVCGRLSMDSWTGQGGEKRTKIFVTVSDWSFCTSKSVGGEEPPF